MIFADITWFDAHLIRSLLNQPIQIDSETLNVAFDP